MTKKQTHFQAGVDFNSVLRIISKQVYETPLAFIRENVQNAVDAVRIQIYRDGASAKETDYRIEVVVKEKKIIVRDHGIGMSGDDLKKFFWTIGASGKRTHEALAAGCVGTFGIGGFANFGVCEKLEVVSQTEDEEHGTLTYLSEEDISKARTSTPQVTQEASDAAKPRGTEVIGHLRNVANVDELQSYLQDFVRFVSVPIYFNGRNISQESFSDIEERENLTELGEGTQEWYEGNLMITGRMFEDRGHTLVTVIESLRIGGQDIKLTGQIRFQNGQIDMFKRGFKLCTTQIGTTIGVSGRLDSDRFVPTAGRDSPDAETFSLLFQIVMLLERVAIETVLATTERVAQHTRIFQYVISKGLVSKLEKTAIRLADGSENTLGNVRSMADSGVKIYFGITQKQALNQIMQARGHVVVLLSSDHYKREAERQYLEQYCAAKTFDGMIDCIEHYKDLNRFEKIFLSELELNISRSYEVEKFSLIAGKLSEDIPVLLKEHGEGRPPDIFVDVRHNEITKLENLGYTQIFYSLVAMFCLEYLGPSLKKWSPRFFGDGALNLELLAKRRSELWILVKDDVGLVYKGGQRHVVTRADIQKVEIGSGQVETQQPQQRNNPRILHIVDESGTTGIGGYYIRLPDTTYRAYGDLLLPCEDRGVVWTGNKITYSASDTVCAAFQYEIRLDELVIAEVNDAKRAEGAIKLEQPFQEIFDGLYFPIPTPLESFLVPTGNEEIRLHLHCEWIDMRTAKHWLAKENTA